MLDPTVPTPALRVTTSLLDHPGPLLPLLDASAPLVFVRRGEGIAGLGEALRLEFRGPDRMREASAAWSRIAAAASVEDAVRMPGTGLVAFGSFAFADDSDAASVLVVPRTVIGRRDGRTWITRVEAEGDTAAPDPAATPWGDEYRVQMLPGSLTRESYKRAVAAAVERIAAGTIGKVVLARDLTGTLPEGSDLRRVLADLALGYPDCWTFAVDGLVGSTPEMLVQASRGTVRARVLAGSIARGDDATADQEAAIRLATSSKDLDEHRFAVRSLVGALAPHTSTMTVSEMPFTLKLPNLWHLASDVEGELADGSTSLDLADALHPTAAVAGTPTPDALRLIAELEPFDRGRYAAPVGWIGADGDGEWALALRCAHVSPSGRITAYAGAGIVEGSVPEQELAETAMKFRPITEAFG